MMTGDNETTARTVATRLGIKTFEASLTPQDKHDRVRVLRESGPARHLQER